MDTKEFCIVYVESGELRTDRFMTRNVGRVVASHLLTDEAARQLNELVKDGLVGHGGKFRTETGAKSVVIWRTN